MIATIERFVELVFTVQVLIPLITLVTEAATVIGVIALLLNVEFRLTLVLILVLEGRRWF